MNKLLIDVTRLVGRLLKGRLPTGVDRVCLEYVRRYGTESQALIRWKGRFFIFPNSLSAALFSWLLVPTSKSKVYRVLAGGMLCSCSHNSVHGFIIINVGHTGLEQPSYASKIQGHQLKPLFMVYDLIPITHPEYCRPGENLKHFVRMQTALEHASGLVCISKAIQDELTTFAHTYKLQLPPTISALLAPALPDVPDNNRPLEDSYFVILGTIEPRKNHLMILNVWRRLAERLGERTPRLVIIGQRGWECENVVDMLERCEILKKIVIELPACSDIEASVWMRHAQAMLFPSFTEGYGLPLIEALSLGTPVIASNLGVFREIAGDIPEYLDPLDGLGWMAMIERYIQKNSPERALQIKRMNGFEIPTWESHFKQVDTFLEQVCR